MYAICNHRCDNYYYVLFWSCDQSPASARAELQLALKRLDIGKLFDLFLAESINKKLWTKIVLTITAFFDGLMHSEMIRGTDILLNHLRRFWERLAKASRIPLLGVDVPPKLYDPSQMLSEFREWTNPTPKHNYLGMFKDFDLDTKFDEEPMTVRKYQLYSDSDAKEEPILPIGHRDINTNEGRLVQRMESEIRRREELGEGHLELKDVLPVSNQESSKVDSDSEEEPSEHHSFNNYQGSPESRKEASRKQRMEAEIRRRAELREGYLKLKDVLPVSNQKSSKLSLLERATNHIVALEQEIKKSQQPMSMIGSSPKAFPSQVP